MATIQTQFTKSLTTKKGTENTQRKKKEEKHTCTFTKNGIREFCAYTVQCTMHCTYYRLEQQQQRKQKQTYHTNT